MREHEGLLHGIRVIDLTTYPRMPYEPTGVEGQAPRGSKDEEALPPERLTHAPFLGQAGFCAKLLADMGASVVMIERPSGTSEQDRGESYKNNCFRKSLALFEYHNANKLGITLDIKKEEGKEIFRRLTSNTDVVVEAFDPGGLEGLGLGFDVLSEVNPRLILASITGFGQVGPKSHYKSCDLVASAFGGQMYVTGSPSTPPLRAYGEQSSYAASLFAAVAIMLALRRRHKSRRGEHLDISAQEAVASTLDHVLVRYFHDHVIAERQGNLAWNNSSFIICCKDGHFLINIGTQWETLVELMASEAMTGDLMEDRWEDERYRFEHIDHVISVVERWAKNYSRQELFELGQSMRFPWAPVMKPEETLKCPQLKERRFFTEIEQGRSGPIVLYPGTPYAFNHARPKEWKRAPLTGEDNAKVYRDGIGLTEMEIKRLISLKVI
jgi:crotonobetainyl-CoA:carnitine CoA-transferase CaiB-like acyl-CoA transferase